ncbi:LuxR family transcriptional regulator [Rhodococcus erythropolis]|uniref:helix-turn-helix transcriptional regulator n=1 Tax=Rhodococcus erythropolis TaxID=1833 RepID=UPI001C9AC80C|nr:helix-turn-helix transcriptional regulator [Rhodococcus erythropolis]MBY6385400.1 LuxR family transcriptional regulator [Rhodococcus erythropolis]
MWVGAPAQNALTPAAYWFGVLARLRDAGVTSSSADSDDVCEIFTTVVRLLESTSRPVLLVLIRPDLIYAGGLCDQLISLLSLCPEVDIVVTLSGLGMFSGLRSLGIDHDIITAKELRYTAPDTAQLLAQADAPAVADNAERITSLTGGIPALVQVAVAAIKNLDNGSDREKVLERQINRAVDRYTAHHVLALAEELGELEFVLATAYAGTITSELARLVSSSEDTVAQVHTRLAILEAAGLYDRVESESEETWELPSGIRHSILRMRAAAGTGSSLHLSRLVDSLIDSGRQTLALDYALDAQNWTLAIDIVEQYWVEMLVNDIDRLSSGLRRIPLDVAGEHPVVRAVRALFDGHPIVTLGTLADPPTLFSDQCARHSAKDALSVGCIESIMLRLTGRFEESAAITRRLPSLSHLVLEDNSEVVSRQLPFMRAQWAITYQLNAMLAESTIEAHLAYQDGLSLQIDFVARAASSTIALNWAMVGEPRHSLVWLECEQRHTDHNGRLEPILRTAGLVARTLTLLDSLSIDEAIRTLDELGYPSDTEELWAFVIYAHSQCALTRGDPFAALTLMRRTVAAHSHQHTVTSISVPLLQATEIDLLLALGEGTSALALAGSINDPAAYPWTLTSVARLRQRVGDNKAALALCHQYSWTLQSYPRAQMELLLVQAVAHWELGGTKFAVEAWSKACKIADQTGLLRPFSTIAPSDIVRLENAATFGSQTLAVFRKGPGDESFPKTLHIVTLTDREQTVLSLLGQEMTQVAMAKTLYVSVNTVRSQLRSLYRKLDAHNRDEALMRAHALKVMHRA